MLHLVQFNLIRTCGVSRPAAATERCSVGCAPYPAAETAAEMAPLFRGAESSYSPTCYWSSSLRLHPARQAAFHGLSTWATPRRCRSFRLRQIFAS